MLFHENRLLADDFYEISYLIFSDDSHELSYLFWGWGELGKISKLGKICHLLES